MSGLTEHTAPRGFADPAVADGIAGSHVSVHPDGTVSLIAGKVDLGQGISTALAQIAADGLGVSVERIRVIHADTTVSPDERYTSGSFSVEKGGTAVRQAAVELRGRLMAMAAEDLGVPSDQLAVVDGAVSGPDGNSTTYWKLAGGASTVEAQADTGPVVGTTVGRWDFPAKFAGAPAFVQDLELAGMLHGRVLRPPSTSARLISLDPARTEALPGVIEVIRSGDFIGVVAEREEQALRALRRLELDAEWDDPPPPDTLLEPAAMLDQEAEITVAVDRGELPDRISHSARFTRPFIAHGSIGPSCAVAVSDDAGLTVWSHTQGVYPLRGDLATALGLPEEQVRVIHLEGAGCYGHNGADDAALDAALLARAVPGRPVRLQWSRADEFGWEPYGSPMVVDLSATLDGDGSIAGWTHDVWSHSHMSRPGSTGGIGLLAAWYVDPPAPMPEFRDGAFPPGGGLRNSVPLYDLPNLRVTGHLVSETPIRTSALRSLGSHANIFAIESFMEELAGIAGVDPVEFRLRHLSDPRARAVIETVIERAGVPVGGTNDQGHGFGLGFGRYKNAGSYVAVVAQVAAEEEVRLIRAWAVVDAGLIVNPDGARNQIEGGIIQSASWALKEQAKLEGDRNITRSWLDYPILTFRDTPELDVHLIDRPEEKSVGVGEGAQGPTTAAIANGIRAALGISVRDLPFTPERMMKAILG